MTHHVIAFLKPADTTIATPAMVPSSARTSIHRIQSGPVALAVALRYLAVRRRLRRVRTAAAGFGHD